MTTNVTARVRSMRLEPHLRALTGREAGGPLRVDRKTKWGNPFSIGKDGSRAEIIAKYRRNLWREIKTGQISIAELASLAGRDLVCHCVPHACHAEVLLQAIQWAVAKLARQTKGAQHRTPTYAQGDA